MISAQRELRVPMVMYQEQSKESNLVLFYETAFGGMTLAVRESMSWVDRTSFRWLHYRAACGGTNGKRVAIGAGK
jgi:hypothetical protein